jgi:deoxyribodipyrimidine photo-lyase
MTENVNVFWFRRDLRLEDNKGLFEALNSGKTLPIFIFDSSILSELDKDDSRLSFIYQTLIKIHQKLKGTLKVFIGKPIDIWQQLMSDYHIDTVFYNKDYEPYASERDHKIGAFLKSKNINFIGFKDQVIFEEKDILKSDGTPYTIYTPYKKKWLAKYANDLTDSFPCENLLHQVLKVDFPFPSLEEIGFKASLINIPAFSFDNLADYENVRDIPSLNQTSHLSTHLRFGTISVRQAVKRAKSINQIFLSELIWREFFMQILFNFPYVVNASFKSKYDRITWRNNEADFEKWSVGKTGYPMVDAGMRELNETGLMHNRVRMVTASFLVKHLLIDWRWGEAYFAKKLLDYDLSANNGNWQWAAGTGCDAAPYFRIFNPEAQQKRFDPKAIYIRKWVTEFDELSYPLPMVDHKYARERCLKTFKEGLV